MKAPNTSIEKLLAAAAISLATLFITPAIHAQVCSGTSMVSSTLQYIVREAKGVAIDAGQQDLQIAKSDSPRG